MKHFAIRWRFTYNKPRKSPVVKLPGTFLFINPLHQLANIAANLLNKI